MAIGDSAELFVTGTLAMRADDNIILAKEATSDVITDAGVGAELTFGKNSQTQGAITLRHVFTNYAEESKYNTNLFNGDVVAKFDDGKMKLGFNAGYHELNQNTVDVRGLIRRDVANVGANTEVGVSQITAAAGAVAYSRENYHPQGFVDSETVTVPLNFYYKWTPKVDLSLGYRYRDYKVNSGSALDSVDNFFSVGARGEFSPKLTGTFAVGYTQRRYAGNAGNRGLPGVDASFAYEVSPKTSFQLSASNDFGTSATGLQQKNLTINGLVTTKLNEEWSINGGLSYRGIKYDFQNTAGRTDDFWEANLGATYVLNANVSFVGGYTYRTFQSQLSETEFDNNVFSLALNVRY